VGRLVMVWCPRRRSDPGLAVAVRALGGPPCDGGRLTKDGILVGTANYRLGRFADCAMQPCAGEAADHPRAGNSGRLHPITALRWVRAFASPLEALTRARSPSPRPCRRRRKR
jgi:hypothetical protein